ncbi:MAG: SDR family NAD(P)-dependent oxidoreductase [Terriglobales bacterium]
MPANLKTVGLVAAAAAAAVLVGSGVSLVTAIRLWKKVRSGGYKLSGKTVVITGGSRGLGLAIARQCVGQGARVAIIARDPHALDRARLILNRGQHENVIAISCDVTDKGQVEGAFEVVRKKFGPIDVLVNNAGLITVGPMESMTLDDFRDSLNLHFWAPLYTTLAVLPEMRLRKQGRIVNISSIGGKISVPHLLPYSAGKFALAGFSEGVRTEVAKDNIYVTSVYPGLMRTGSPRNATFKGRHRAEYAWFSVSDSMPGISMSADRAARQIVSACRRGDSILIVSLPAKVAITLHQLFPRASSSVLDAVNRAFPAVGGIGKESRLGKESASWVSPSLLTALDEFAARKNNEAAV